MLLDLGFQDILCSPNLCLMYGKLFLYFHKCHLLQHRMLLQDLLENHPTIKNITAVDADKVIIDLAKKYLQSNLKDKIEYICDDAEKFGLNTKQKFDLVLFDVFIDDETPIQFMQKDFLIALKNLVAISDFVLCKIIADSSSIERLVESAQGILSLRIKFSAVAISFLQFSKEA